MLKSIKNITERTISIPIFGHNYEIQSGWSLTAEEVWGGEETLRYIAVKLADSVKSFDEDGKEVKMIICAGCGSEIEVNKGQKIKSDVYTANLSAR